MDPADKSPTIIIHEESAYAEGEGVAVASDVRVGDAADRISAPVHVHVRAAVLDRVVGAVDRRRFSSRHVREARHHELAVGRAVGDDAVADSLNHPKQLLLRGRGRFRLSVPGEPARSDSS